MAGDQGHNANVNANDSVNADANANVSADAGASAKKKSQFTLSDWIEGAVLLVTGVLFVLWLVK
ncbi:hypothetical protein [Streptomyces sp. NPDC050355]|uniref:hypothetical protein n=1 Tax=Streptomyces sp. NPDC050355 TaxID=3365609 RepID=UPI0037A2464C